MSEPSSTASAGIDPATVFKLASVWAAVGITSWAEFASFLAAMYTILLIAEWFWKKFWRSIFERRGWVKPLRNRRAYDD